MKPERWEEIKRGITSQYEIEHEGEEKLDPPPGTAEVLEFDGPMGYMRVEYVTKPKTVGRKVHGSRRIGSESYEEKLYSEDETVSYLQIFTWDEDTEEWNEVEQELFS